MHSGQGQELFPFPQRHEQFVAGNKRDIRLNRRNDRVDLLPCERRQPVIHFRFFRHGCEPGDEHVSACLLPESGFELPGFVVCGKTAHDDLEPRKV